ncbi:hypothetical protein Y032_0022g635 [Ancylostoma ceylanicum]|nr:hypothetical protein Y032_0022g635 [Ancylostoma ceylanicum]
MALFPTADSWQGRREKSAVAESNSDGDAYCTTLLHPEAKTSFYVTAYGAQVEMTRRSGEYANSRNSHGEQRKPEGSIVCRAASVLIAHVLRESHALNEQPGSCSWNAVLE